MKAFLDLEKESDQTCKHVAMFLSWNRDTKEKL